MSRTHAILGGVLVAACAASGAERDPSGESAADARTATSGCPAAPGARLVTISRVDSLVADPQGRYGGGAGPWYRIAPSPASADSMGEPDRRTMFARPAMPETDLNGDGIVDLVVSIPETMSGYAEVETGVYAGCGGSVYATVWKPEYAYEIRRSRRPAAPEQRGWADLVWVQRSGSGDPNRDHLNSRLLRFAGSGYRFVEGSERILPTGANDCPLTGTFVSIFEDVPQDDVPAGPGPVSLVVHPDTIPGSPEDYPLPIAARRSWAGDLNEDEFGDRIVVFPRGASGAGAPEVGVYAGCGGYRYVQVRRPARALAVTPADSRTEAGGGRWRELVVQKDSGPAERLRFGGRAYP